MSELSESSEGEFRRFWFVLDEFLLLEMTVVWLLKKVRQRERVVRHSSTPDEQSVPRGV